MKGQEPWQDERVEWLACAQSPAYFLHRYGWVYDGVQRRWVQFRLWPMQRQVLRAMHERPRVVVLKARQLGLTWLGLGYALWLMLFRPAATVLLFSRRDEEATELLDDRMRGMYERLPPWLAARHVRAASSHEWRLSNGSAAKAFPTTGGRSYTASMALVDEADFVPDLDGLLNAVKPTVDAGGKLVLLSTADKSQPESAFKRVYRGAQAGSSGWTALFLGWRCRPDRDDAWYERQKAEALARSGNLDGLWQEYPGTEQEALATRSAMARYPVEWLRGCDGVEEWERGRHGDTETRRQGEAGKRGPAIAGLAVFEAPAEGQWYVIGADPAEGNPQSDESAATVLDSEGRQVACLAGRYDPAVFAGYLEQISRYYNDAGILVERNNHGHAVLVWLGEHSAAELVRGPDVRPGWLTTMQSKTLLFDQAAERFRAGEALVRDRETLRQLEGIEGARLTAPEGQRDDRAMSFLLALAALRAGRSTGQSYIIRAVDVIEEADRGRF